VNFKTPNTFRPITQTIHPK